MPYFQTNNLALIQEAALFGSDGVLDFGPIAIGFRKTLGEWEVDIPSYGETYYFARMGEALDFACMVARAAT